MLQELQLHSLVYNVQRLQVLLFFQRYYGKSLPFGNDSFTSENIGYLTIEQALADYSYLIKYLKNKYNATNAPVIAFGGRQAMALCNYC